jgi:hypothetical protein
MAHFAKLDDTNRVVQVIVVHNNEMLDGGVESEAKGIAFCESLFGGRWVQTSYSGSFRKQFAGVGFTYDPVADAFLTPQPFPSWTLDSNHDWQPPAPMPEGSHEWNESTLTWMPTDEMKRSY